MRGNYENVMDRHNGKTESKWKEEDLGKTQLQKLRNGQEMYEA